MIKYLADFEVKIKLAELEKNKTHRDNLQFLTLSEILKKLLIFRTAQIESYPQQYTLLSKEKCLSKNRSLILLNPIRQDNFICVGRRIISCKTKHACKYQVIIDKSYPITKLIKKFCHETGARLGREHTLALIRRKM